MKAIELLRYADYDASIMERGQLVNFNADNGPEQWFGKGTRLISGEIDLRTYFSLYDSEKESFQSFFLTYHPEAVLRQGEENIYLWKIEDGNNS